MKESRKFKVISSIGEGKEFFTNMEFDYVIENDELGTEVNCLGGKFKITQNGKIFVLVNQDWVLTIQDISPAKVEENPKLIINENVEIYVDNREIHVSQKCTYQELFDFLDIEWRLLNSIPGVSVPFPLEMRENNNLLLKANWNLIGFENISEGSFERHSFDGRSI